MGERTKWTTQELLNLNLDDSTHPARLVLGQAQWNGSAWVAVDYNPLASFGISDKDSDASPNYYGFLNPAGAWYIMKETLSAGNDSYRYEYGVSAYATHWTGRATETYHNLSAVF